LLKAERRGRSSDCFKDADNYCTFFAAFEPAYEAIKQALDLEDDQAEWHYLAGKVGLFL